MELQWKNKKEARAWARSFAAELRRPCVVLLSGELGAGKTQLVRWFLEDLGVDDVQSPTFAIHQAYPSSAGDVDHVDLYRLQSDSDLESSGFWDLFEGDRGLVFVEWADRLPETVWPAGWKKIFVSLAKSDSGEESRVVRVRVKL
jgi:tRNA threonylcarbamoyladenosine biosynthesis protein TsaE